MMFMNLRLDTCPPELRERLQQGIRDLEQLTANKGDGKDWARKIIKRVHDGQRVNVATLRIACDCLGLHDPASKAAATEVRKLAP